MKEQFRPVKPPKSAPVTTNAQPTGASNARYVRFEELAANRRQPTTTDAPTGASNARYVRFEELAANRRQPTTDPSTDSLRPVKPPKSAALATNQVQRGVFRVSVGHAGRGVTA